MESPNLTLLNQFSIKGPINRYCICRVNYPPNVNAVFDNLLDVDSSLSMQNIRRDSMEDFQVEGECVVYSQSKSIYAVDIKQPTYVENQQCLNLETSPDLYSPIACMTAFALPQHYKSPHSLFNFATCFIIVYDTKREVYSKFGEKVYELRQMIKFYEDREKEIQYEIANKHSEEVIHQDKIIWLNSHYVPFGGGCVHIIIIGYNNNKVGVFSLIFEHPNHNITQQSVAQLPQLSLLALYDFPEKMIFQDFILIKKYDENDKQNIEMAICMTSFEGLLALRFLNLIVELKDLQYRLQLVFDPHYELFVNRQLYQPKFIKQKVDLESVVDISSEHESVARSHTNQQAEQQGEIYMIVPTQCGQLLFYRNIDRLTTNINNFQVISLREGKSIKQIITGFDVSEKRRQFQMASSGNIFEICVTYHDGTLQIFELSLEISDKNEMIIKTRLQLMKKINYARFFVNSLQFSTKQFLVLGSEEEIGVYELSYYQIN